MKTKKIILACDYRGIEMRDALNHRLKESGIHVKDIGIESGSRMDYIDITKLLSDELFHDHESFGVIICGSGQGVAIYANRSSHIRAGICRSQQDAEDLRNKLDANVMCLGSKNTSIEEAEKYIKTFVSTPFITDKHAQCVQKLGAKVTEHSQSGVNLITRAIIIHNDHILLTTPTSENKEFGGDLYFLPGGHVDHNESVIEALKRELMEEMGMNSEIIEFSGSLECSWDRKGKLYHELNMVYAVELPSSDVKISPKALDPFHRFIWIPMNDIDKIQILPEKLVSIIKSSFNHEKPQFQSQMIKKLISDK